MKHSSNSLRFIRSSALLVGAIVSLAAGPVLANENPDRPTKLEALLLPAYCHSQFGIPSEPSALWENCGHLMNHFCPALVHINRANKSSTSPEMKKYAVKRARKNIDYTKAGMPANCKLAPEVNAADTRLRTLEMFIK